MARTNTDSADIAEFLAKRGATKIAQGQSSLVQRLDIRCTPAETRTTQSDTRNRYGFCEDAPCCGCCDPRIGMVKGHVR